MSFSVPAIFSFTSTKLTKYFPLMAFSSRETKKKSCSGHDQMNGMVGHGVHAIFGQKQPNILLVWAGVLISHPLRNGQMLKES